MQGYIAFGDIPLASKSILFGMDGGGRDLVDSEIEKIISKKGSCTILEIGSFLGHSTVRWLNFDKRVSVVVSDFFKCTSKVFRSYIDQNVDWATKQFDCCSRDEIDLILDLFDSPDGHLRLFAANLQPFSDRIKIYKGRFEDNANEIQNNESIDMVYLDADKSDELLNFVYSRFSSAKLCGDDWNWGPNKGFPMQKAIKSFADSNRFLYRANKATWVIDDV